MVAFVYSISQASVNAVIAWYYSAIRVFVVLNIFAFAVFASLIVKFHV